MTTERKTEAKIHLKRGREKPFVQGNPWVFSGAVHRIEGDVEPGDVATLLDGKGNFLGRGFVNKKSQILLRVVTRNDEALDEELIRQRLTDAKKLREKLLPGQKSVRVVNAEGDDLPGLVVDRYEDVLVAQLGIAAWDRRRDLLGKLLSEVFGVDTIAERSDMPSRKEEGLEPRVGMLVGDEPGTVEFDELGLRFTVDPLGGHKTGFYLDQREARALCRDLADGADMLDVCSYTGGFAVAAMKGGAKSVTTIEDNAGLAPVIEGHLAMNHPANGEAATTELLSGDAFKLLRELDGDYDVVVLDPPPFARSKRHVQRACRGYKELNLQAMKRVRSGGILMSFCCSHHVDETLYRQVVFAAAVDAGRRVQVLKTMGAPADHPVSVFHLQGSYLKGMVLRVL